MGGRCIDCGVNFVFIPEHGPPPQTRCKWCTIKVVRAENERLRALLGRLKPFVTVAKIAFKMAYERGLADEFCDNLELNGVPKGFGKDAAEVEPEIDAALGKEPA